MSELSSSCREDYEEVFVCRDSDEVPSEYDGDHERRGMVLILDLYKTQPTMHDTVKEGFERDVDHLRRTFGILQFQPKVVKAEEFENKEGLIKYLEEVAQDKGHYKCDCFALVAIGMECRREVLRAWDADLDIKEIWQCFTADKCPYLARKPKLFFFQAFWRIDVNYLTNAYTENSFQAIRPKVYSIPVEADILIVYPSVEDVDTMREGFKGSPFVSSLCTILREDYRRAKKQPVQNLMAYLCHSLDTHQYRLKDTGAIIKRFPTVASTLLSRMYLRRKFSDNSDFDEDISEEMKLAKPRSQSKSQQNEVEKRVYDDSLEFRGKAVIANFYTKKKEGSNDVEERQGSEKDFKNVVSIFKSLQFDVTKAWNEKDIMTKRWFLENLREVAKEDHRKSECLVIVVMCHGGAEGELRAFDEEFQVKEVWECFSASSCPTLAGKPKILFFQACRGCEFSAEVNADFGPENIPSEQHWVPGEVDFLIAYPTFQDRYSLRHPTYGSPFINALCKVLEEDLKAKEKEPLQTILTTVCAKVAAHRWEHVQQKQGIKRMNIIKQMPTVVSTLRNLLFFKKKFF